MLASDILHNRAFLERKVAFPKQKFTPDWLGDGTHDGLGLLFRLEKVRPQGLDWVLAITNGGFDHVELIFDETKGKYHL